MATVVNQYRVYCVTESEYQYVWGTVEPTTCPNNNSHTITSSATVIVSKVESKDVIITQEIIPTGGSYRAETRKLTMVGNDTVQDDRAWLFPANALAIQFHTSAENIGDTVTLAIAPNTTVGILTSDVAVNDTILNVSSTVTDFIRVGYELTLTDGINTEVLGVVVNVNPGAGQVTVETACPTAFAAATPTYVQQTVYFIKDFYLQGPYTYKLGDTTIGSSYIPTGTIVRIKYTNNSAAAKTFVGIVELFY